MRNTTLMLSASLFFLPHGCPPPVPDSGGGDGGGGTDPVDGPSVGVLISSYGDVDALDEIEELVTNTVGDPDVVPVPAALGGIIASLGWQMVKDDVAEEYAALGYSTGMRANTRAQGESVAAALRARGINAKAYVGFTMTFPYVAEALDEARTDGVERLVVFYQGAQYSHVTAYIVFRHVREYLAEHPDWDVNVVGVRSFTHDSRFLTLLDEGVERQVATTYPEAEDTDICLFLPMHGNVLHWIEQGDPYLDQVMHAVDHLSGRFSEMNVSFGFQNHDELPFTEWTEPNTDTALDAIAAHPCPYVVIDGRISFTTDSLETLFDHAIAEPEYLLEQASALGNDKSVVVTPMFNSQPGFVELLTDLAIEALDGQGDIEIIGAE